MVSRPAPGQVRPAHQIDNAEGEEFGLGPEIGAILSALQGRDSRGRWLLGRFSELIDHTEAGFRGALQRAAAEAYLECLPGAAIVMLPSLNADGTCTCALGARCFVPGRHPRRNAQGEVLRARWAGDVAVMPWELVRADLALEMGADSGLIGMTAEPGATMPDESWRDTLTVATAANCSRTFLYQRPRAPHVPSAMLGEGVRLYGDRTLLRVPPFFGPDGISLGWDASEDGAPVEPKPGLLPLRVVWCASRAARGIR